MGNPVDRRLYRNSGVTVCDTLAVRVCTEELLIETFIVSFGTREKTVYTSVYGGTLYISSDIC
jgi:hypothetical protein